MKIKTFHFLHENYNEIDKTINDWISDKNNRVNEVINTSISEDSAKNRLIYVLTYIEDIEHTITVDNTDFIAKSKYNPDPLVGGIVID